MSNPHSGVLTPSLYLSSTLHEIYKILSTPLVIKSLDHDSQTESIFVDPSTSLPPPEEYYARVAEVHENGGYGSIGYRAPFSREESQKLLLRTHTTSCSSRLLHEIATQPGGFKPAKLFSIDRVFRNEATDMTHLAEFHQVEGVVADRNITLADLIGIDNIMHVSGDNINSDT